MLALCLDRLAPGVQTLDASQYMVIVTDDGQTDEAKKLLAEKYLFASYTKGPRWGPAANRNNGAKFAKGDWLVFLDDDCLPDANWLQQYAVAIGQHPAVQAFEGAILPDSWAALKKDMAECPVNDKGGCFWSANVAIEKKLFVAIGGFDEQFKMAAQEDQDIFERLQQKTKCLFLPTAIVVHPVRVVALGKKIKQIPPSIRNWYLFEKKKHSFSTVLAKGLKSQLAALAGNAKALKIKSTIFNLATMALFFPIMFSIKFFDEKQ